MKSENLLPQPFEWVTIPTGDVTLNTEPQKQDNYIPKTDTGTVFSLPAFEIGKYPITNAQFAKFIEAGGYSNDIWWTQAGIVHRDEEQWIQPRFWQDTAFMGDDKPVVGISWYESIAFSLWLSHVTGEQISLPTEQQWQRAAQGNTKQIFVWGNHWDGRLCNHNVNKEGVGQPSSVRQYEGKGDSPFGVVDMAGNIWEWCLTLFETGSHDIHEIGARCLRGASWSNTVIDYYRAINRNWGTPDFWFDSGGFRIVREIK